jgi:predicted small metal-binding protein
MFVVGKPVINQNFFDRNKMKKQISNFISSKQDFMLKAPRRYGKTSLIKEVLKNEQYIYLDIRKLSSVEKLPYEIIEKAYEIHGISNFTQKVKNNVVKFLSNIKLNTTIKFDIIEANAEYITSTQEKNICEELVHALQTVENIGKDTRKTLTIVFDEFQDITKFKCEDNSILEVLRGTLQHFENTHCIFLGSIETIMTDIFENKKSPFFNYCRKFKLEPFDIEELYEELLITFENKNIFFEDNKQFKELLYKLQGHPANTMVVMQNIYFIALEKNKKALEQNDINQAFENGYFEMLDLIEQYIIEIKDKKHHHDVLYKLANNEKQTLIPQALHQVKSSLLDMGYLQKIDKGNYKIVDNFLLHYLQN